MLALSRHKNESIIIGGGLIEIMVLEIKGNKVRLGVNAPRELRVDRKEVAAERKALGLDDSVSRLPPAPDTFTLAHGADHATNPVVTETAHAEDQVQELEAGDRLAE